MTEQVLFAYTVEDALRDGAFIDITEQAQKIGFSTPVVITANLHEKYIKVPEALGETITSEEARLLDPLWQLRQAIQASTEKDGDMVEFEAFYLMPPIEVVKHWAFLQAFSQEDPHPVVTIMLPEDY